MIVRARAPVRIDFAGGWTDVPAFANAEGGVVVNAAIARYAMAECRLGGATIRLRSEDLAEHVTVSAAHELRYDGTLDLHKAALNMLPVTGGIEILTRADVPVGSGLGASGALDVALIGALAACRSESYTRHDVAEMGFDVEATELKLEGGRQDQYAAALGGWHELRFTAEGVTCLRIDASPDAWDDLARHVVLAYTGESHFSSQTHHRVWTAYAEGRSTVVEALRTMRELATEAAACLVGGDWQGLARAVDGNWHAQQQLDATISTPRVRRVEAALREAGAWGLKATGAGAGGCLVALAAPERVERVEAAARATGAELLDVAFDARGLVIEVERSEDDRR